MSNAPQYIDISFYNQIENWFLYKQWAAQWDGISRVAMRSSYGTGYTDSKFAAFRAGALAAGIDQIIYYHYAYPQLNSGAAEANWQKQVVGTIREQDVLMLDFEENVPQATAQWAYEWLAQQEQNYGRLPTLYASASYIAQRLQDSRLAAFPLTLAYWQFTPDERPACPQPWSSYEFVQYTDRATNIPGVPGEVDANIFLGGEAAQMSINTFNPTVAAYFQSNTDGTIWTCKNGFEIHGEILQFYRNSPNQGLAGLTDLGLPTSNEIALDGEGNTQQKFERGFLNFDPGHVHDNPPGAGRVYKAHVPQNTTSYAALKSELLAEAKLIGDTATQMMTTISAQLL